MIITEDLEYKASSQGSAPFPCIYYRVVLKYCSILYMYLFTNAISACNIFIFNAMHFGIDVEFLMVREHDIFDEFQN